MRQTWVRKIWEILAEYHSCPSQHWRRIHSLWIFRISFQREWSSRVRNLQKVRSSSERSRCILHSSISSPVSVPGVIELPREELVILYTSTPCLQLPQACLGSLCLEGKIILIFKYCLLPTFSQNLPPF